MFNIQEYIDGNILYHKVVNKNGKEYPVWVCKKGTNPKIKDELKQIDKEYKKCYGIPLIGFEKE